MLLTFNSIEEFAAACRDTPESCQHSANDWTADTSWQEALDKSTLGDESYVKDAEELIAKLEVDMPETKAWKTVASPYGGRVSLSDWLTGSPTPMRRKRRTESEFAPVSIIVSTTSSAGVDAETMKRRGAAILALLLKLQQVRPVELYLLAEMHGASDGWHYQLIRIESRPLAVGVAAFALCNVGFARQLTYGLGKWKDHFNGQWPLGYSKAGYADTRKARLGIAGQTIVVKEAHLSDPILSDPVTWIKEAIGKAIETE